MTRLTTALALSLLLALSGAASAEMWAKGNTHGHSTLSDGNLPPAEALGWYRDHGYAFTFLTDHNVVADIEVFRAASTPTFLALPGMELDSPEERGINATHMNALGPWPGPEATGAPFALARPVGKTTKEVIASELAAVVGAGSVVQLNHPALLLTDPSAAAMLPDNSLIEVFNNSVATSPIASLAQPLFERTWDAALTAGRRVWCAASDDVHNYADAGPGEIDTAGGGWLMVRVAELTPEEVLRAIRAGDFYSSSGVTLRSLTREGTTLALEVEPKEGVTYQTVFLGAKGEKLATVEGTSASLVLPAGQAYLRARVEASDGSRAWTQPVWPG